MGFKASLFCLSFIFSSLSFAQNLAEEVQWKRILHYSNTNPVDELKKSIEMFHRDPQSQCLFPARFLFLQRNLKTEQWPHQSCPEFEKFRSTMLGESLSLVFSSYYLNNPSSAFGHTFIRINKAPDKSGKRLELLDTGVSYYADSDSNNFLIYSFKGIFGMFPGRFTSVPYYFKVREYNNFESRDLWEYELNVGPKEVEMFTAFIWELRQYKIPYWFLSENCSYHILVALEAAAPQIDVLSTSEKWVVPADTVKDLWNQPSIVKQVRYRPSIRSEYHKRFEQLSNEEKTLFDQLVKNGSVNFLSSLPNGSRLNILDVAIDYAEFSQKPEAFKNSLLEARSEIKISTEPLDISAPEQEKPHLTHGSHRLNLGVRGSQQGNDASLFGAKFALHDQTDLATGYPASSAINFADFQFSYLRESKKLELEALTFVEVLSYESFSWRMKFNIEKQEDQNCLGCHALAFSAGIGQSFHVSIFDFFAGLRFVEFYTPYGTGNRFLTTFGPSAQLRIRWSEKFISLIEGWYRYDLNSSFDRFQKYEFATQYSFNQDWATKISATDLIYDRKAQLEIFYMY